MISRHHISSKCTGASNPYILSYFMYNTQFTFRYNGALSRVYHSGIRMIHTTAKLYTGDFWTNHDWTIFQKVQLYNGLRYVLQKNS